MTQEERTRLESEVQKVCELWISILNMQQWVITIKAKDDGSVFDTVVYGEIAQAKIDIPTGDTWLIQFPDIPYHVENYLVMQLLRVKFFKNNIPREDLAYLANCLIELKLRGDRLEQAVRELQEQLERAMTPPEPEDGYTQDPKIMDEPEPEQTETPETDHES